MQPDRVCVPLDILVYVHTINGWRSLNSLLFPVDEDSLILSLPALLFRLFSWSEFSLALCHDEYLSVSLSQLFCRILMVSALDNPPVPNPRCPFLTLGTQPLVHVSSICPIHKATDGTFGLVCILIIIGPRYFAMTAALLTIKIEIANFDALTAATMPFNLRIGIFHINRFSQRQA